MDVLNRVTIGLRLSAEQTAEIDRHLLLIKRKPGVNDVRWSQPAEWIVPLVSLGEISVATMAAVKNQVGPFLSNVNRFSAQIAGFGGLPNLIQPRYVTLNFDETYSGALSRLAGAVDKEIGALLPPREIKQLQNYITLGRLKTENEQLRVALGRALKLPEQPAFSPMVFDRLELLSAHATSAGMGYQVVETFPFK